MHVCVSVWEGGGRFRTARAHRPLLRCSSREHPLQTTPLTEACVIRSKQPRGCRAQGVPLSPPPPPCSLRSPRTVTLPALCAQLRSLYSNVLQFSGRPACAAATGLGVQSCLRPVATGGGTQPTLRTARGAPPKARPEPFSDLPLPSPSKPLHLVIERGGSCAPHDAPPPPSPLRMLCNPRVGCLSHRSLAALCLLAPTLGGGGGAGSTLPGTCCAAATSSECGSRRGVGAARGGGGGC